MLTRARERVHTLATASAFNRFYTHHTLGLIAAMCGRGAVAVDDVMLRALPDIRHMRFGICNPGPHVGAGNEVYGAWFTDAVDFFANGGLLPAHATGKHPPCRRMIVLAYDDTTRRVYFRDDAALATVDAFLRQALSFPLSGTNVVTFVPVALERVAPADCCVCCTAFAQCAAYI
jgi:hypothetical protein